MHLGPFGCLTKLCAKRDELVQKFVPRSRVGIFRNERIRSIPVDPNLMFWCVLYYLGALSTVWLHYETRCKIGRTSAKVRATKSCRIFFATNAPNPPHWTLNSCFIAFCTIFGAFATIWLPCETRGERFRTSGKVCPTKSSRNFAQRTHPIHPIGP